jgi:hypothetical protein
MDFSALRHFRETSFRVRSGPLLAGVGRQGTLLTRFAVELEVAAEILTATMVKELATKYLVFSVSIPDGRSMSPAAQAFIDHDRILPAL